MIALGVGVATWSVIGRGDGSSTFEVGVATTSAQTSRPGGASAALAQLERALTEGDRDSAVALAPTGDTEASNLLAAVVANAAEARITGVALRYIDELDAPGPQGSWSAAVAVEWRYSGFDATSARTQTVLRFVSEGGQVRIAGIGGDSLRTPVWMAGPLTVRHGDDTLLLVADADADSAVVDGYDRLVERAVPVVSRVVTDWDARVVVEVPRDAAALERALDVEPGYYQQIAAVTGSADGSIAADAPVHVYLNPDVFDDLGRRGQEVVLDHEIAHVAGDGPISRAPTWLVEGFADYVALRDSSLPLTTTAAQIRDQVRADGAPAVLPGAPEFDTRGPHLGAVYESAWLACQVLAARGGDEAFLRFYDTVSAGASVDGQLSRIFGWSEADLVGAWDQRLDSLP